MMKGTKFQVKVWNYLKTIPKGKVKTYKQVAIGINKPKSARAVANACAKNPYAPKVPCHRVIRSDGTLGCVADSMGRPAPRWKCGTSRERREACSPRNPSAARAFETRTVRWSARQDHEGT